MHEFDFVVAGTLDDLRRLLAETGRRVTAGGTHVLVQLQRGVFPATCRVDASRVGDVRFIREQAGRVQIGALTTYADMLASPLLRETAPALVAAAATVGAPQTRNRGTLGGNLANASPAGDTLPAPLALDAGGDADAHGASGCCRAPTCCAAHAGRAWSPAAAIESVILEIPEASGPYGVRGVGEMGPPHSPVPSTRTGRRSRPSRRAGQASASSSSVLQSIAAASERYTGQRGMWLSKARRIFSRSASASTASR